MTELLLFLILVTLVAALLPGVFWFCLYAFIMVAVVAVFFLLVKLAGRLTVASVTAIPAFLRGWLKVVLSPLTAPRTRWKELRSDLRPNGKQGMILTTVEVGYTGLVAVIISLFALMIPTLIIVALLHRGGLVLSLFPGL